MTCTPDCERDVVPSHFEFLANDSGTYECGKVYDTDFWCFLMLIDDFKRRIYEDNCNPSLMTKLPRAGQIQPYHFHGAVPSELGYLSLPETMNTWGY